MGRLARWLLDGLAGAGAGAICWAEKMCSWECSVVFALIDAGLLTKVIVFMASSASSSPFRPRPPQLRRML